MLKLAMPYVLTNAEFEIFANTLESLKISTGYLSTFGKHIEKKNFGVLKSHDYHVLMQQLMPLALRGLLKPGPRMVVVRMCKVFYRIYTKIYDPT